MEEDVVIGEVEPMGIPDLLLQTGDKIHIHIKQAPAAPAFHMAVGAADMVEAVGAPRNFQPSDLAHFG